MFGFKFVSLLFHRHDLRNCFCPLSRCCLWSQNVITGNLIIGCIPYELDYSNQSMAMDHIFNSFFFLNRDATVLLRMSHSKYEVARHM